MQHARLNILFIYRFKTLRTLHPTSFNASSSALTSMPCWQAACNSAQNEESQQARITRAQCVQLTAVQCSTKLSANCCKTQSRCHNTALLRLQQGIVLFGSRACCATALVLNCSAPSS
eukprot:1071504-Pleurochrysis_carterae.AAC.2